MERLLERVVAELILQCTVLGAEGCSRILGGIAGIGNSRAQARQRKPKKPCQPR
jgi:hypothetical protein